jgi:phosphoribosylaminoimidazole-succinocarboxamide synthase
MNAVAPVVETRLEGLRLLHRGKVRDLYEVGEDLLVVATDRVSAYDCVLTPGIPDKGRVLTSLSSFWFRQTSDVVPNHVITTDVSKMPAEVRRHAAALEGRATLARRLEMFPVECVVRGYLAGSGWKDYRRTGAVSGQVLPPGLVESARLPRPLYTPSTKATVGHDETIDFAATERLVGAQTAAALRDLTVAVYERAARIAAERGILVADTKLEFGRDPAGRIVLADEVLTPDSSRFWDAATYEPGKPQDALDKQMIRDWLDRSGWDHAPPAPTLPPEVVARASETYRTIHRRLTGADLPRLPAGGGGAGDR